MIPLVKGGVGRGEEARGAMHFFEAVDYLVKAGSSDFLPKGYLGRARYYCAVVETNKEERLEAYQLALADLEEVERIAKRGPQRLHHADFHLEMCKLHLVAVGWEKSGEDWHRGEAGRHLEEGEALITACGYGFRTPDVEELHQLIDN